MIYFKSNIVYTNPLFMVSMNFGISILIGKFELPSILANFVVARSKYF